MERIKLLELIRYIKKNNLIEMYNDVYKEYDEKYEDENPGFKLENLYSLSNEQVKLIVSSKHKIEALFRIRMHDNKIKFNDSIYDELMKFGVERELTSVLKILEEICLKEDYQGYDPNKEIIIFTIKQDLNGIDKLEIFMSNMVNKPELSTSGLELKDIIFSLMCISKCKTFKSANLISRLATSVRERILYASDEFGYHNLISIINNAKHDFQVDSIEYLLSLYSYSIEQEFNILDKFENNNDRTEVLNLFTEAKSENACKNMLKILIDSKNIIKENSSYVLELLRNCVSLEDDEEYIDITKITSIDELESALMMIMKNIEINENVKVRVKKKK